LSGVFAPVFAHAGHISKEDAREISGLADHEFEQALIKRLILLKTSCSTRVRRWTSSSSISPN
jgi:hypothetical protein